MLACALSAGSLSAVGCNIGGHSHVWADEYSHDATNHWYACTYEGCTEKRAEKAHSYETQNGKQVCVACGYEKGSFVAVTSVAVSPTSCEIAVGGTKTLTATVSPTNASNTNVTWTSSNESVATVSGGVVSAKKVGTATITVRTEDGNKTATCSVTVKDAGSGSGSGTGTETPTPTEEYTVIFYNEGVKVSTQTVKSGGKVTEPTGLQKTGFVLTGWAQGSASGTLFNLDTAVTQNLSLYAVWEKISAESGITYSYAGNECAAFEWGDANPAAAKVEYKLSTASTYTPTPATRASAWP